MQNIFVKNFLFLCVNVLVCESDHSRGINATKRLCCTKANRISEQHSHTAISTTLLCYFLSVCIKCRAVLAVCWVLVLLYTNWIITLNIFTVLLCLQRTTAVQKPHQCTYIFHINLSLWWVGTLCCGAFL